MELITNFERFSEYVNESENVNEAFLLTKTKRGENPAEYVSTNAPVRAKVLGFIAEKGTVSKQELMEFFEMVEEDLGKKPSWSWMRKNSHLIDTEMSENGDTTYSLTKRGKRVLEVYHNYESLQNFVKNSDEAKKAEIAKAKDFLRQNGIKTLDESLELDEDKIALIESYKAYVEYLDNLSEGVDIKGIKKQIEQIIERKKYKFFINPAGKNAFTFTDKKMNPIMLNGIKVTMTVLAEDNIILNVQDKQQQKFNNIPVVLEFINGVVTGKIK